MPRPKADWDRSTIDLNRTVDNEAWSVFLQKFGCLVGIDNPRYEEACRFLFINASLYKQGRKRGSTDKERLVAAAELKKNAEELSRKLSAGCGGVWMDLMSNGVNTLSLVEELNKVAQVCDKVESSSLGGLYEGTIGHIALAKSVRLVLEEMLCQKASIYINDDGGKEGVYAKVVKGCFIAAVGYVPSGIRKHLIDAKKNAYPSDYLNDVSEENVEAALKATKEKFNFE